MIPTTCGSPGKDGFGSTPRLVRDNALAISGLLVPRDRRPQRQAVSAGRLLAHLNFPVREYEADHGEDLYRRGLYTYWCRTFLHPSLLAFDAPSREECTAERARSNTPLQALVLLNDPTYVEAARVFAEHMLRTGGDRRRRAPATGRFAARFRAAPRRRRRPVLAALYEKHRAAVRRRPAGRGPS